MKPRWPEIGGHEMAMDAALNLEAEIQSRPELSNVALHRLLEVSLNRVRLIRGRLEAKGLIQVATIRLGVHGKNVNVGPLLDHGKKS
jgi:hypothetical protein